MLLVDKDHSRQILESIAVIISKKPIVLSRHFSENMAARQKRHDQFFIQNHNTVRGLSLEKFPAHMGDLLLGRGELFQKYMLLFQLEAHGSRPGKKGGKPGLDIGKSAVGSIGNKGKRSAFVFPEMQQSLPQTFSMIAHYIAVMEVVPVEEKLRNIPPFQILHVPDHLPIR